MGFSCRHPLICPRLAVAAFRSSRPAAAAEARPGLRNVASSTAAATTTTQNGPLAFSRCMRSNGVPTYPDPPAHHTTLNLSLARLGVSGAQFDAAWHTCADLLPNRGQPSQSELAQVISGLLAFGRCMRRHGIPSFPDPTSQGDLNFAGTGIDKSSPVFLAAARTCLPTADGAIRIRPPGQ